MKLNHLFSTASCLVAMMLLAAVSTVMAAPERPAPLFEDFGTLHHPVATSSQEAQRYFDQGLTLCYGFNHKEAIRSFEAVAKYDPDCPMAHWGIAYAHGPHVNKPMTDEDNQKAWKALGRALALRDKGNDLDKAYIDALSKRYQEKFEQDRSALDKAYAAAMREVARQNRDDLDAQVLLAEALMDTMPWDYWAHDRSPKPETEEAIAALKYVMKRNPDHLGANHFYIHAIEAGPTPEIALPSAERLTQGAQTGHLVHMPSHIFIRVGDYERASQANEEAIRVDERYISSCVAQGFYPGVYYPHNVHFLWWSRLFEGRSADALKAARKAIQNAQDNICGPSPSLEAPRFRHLPWLTLARFGRWSEILAVPQPPATNDFLVDRAMWHFARGLAFAAKSDAESATREHQQLAALAGSEEAKKLDSPAFPASSTLKVATHWLGGKAAGARGDKEGMLRELEAAVAAEDALPYMEPSFWSIPVRPTLGAVLLELGDATAAERVFREDLVRKPRNGWGLLGLEQSLRKQGKQAAADNVAREFKQAWKNADTQLELAWF
jgi:tetratricopeptide (TPR) repeat protein